MINFKDKKILITGATGGIGNALVKKFVSLEGNVLATGTKTEKLNALKQEFPNINILKFDISFLDKVIIGFWPEIKDNSSTALSKAFGFTFASPTPIFIEIVVNLGTSIGFV